MIVRNTRVVILQFNMKLFLQQKHLILIILTLSSFILKAQEINSVEKTTTASNVRLNVSSYGTFGNAWRGYKDGTGNPSCEYPAGSGIENLFEGGFWFGGLIDGNRVSVSTSAYDNSSGYSSGAAGFEFYTELNKGLQEFSSLPNSPFFSNSAISHQDFQSVLTDTSLLVPGTQTRINDHTEPLGLHVTMNTFNWNYDFSNFFVITDFTIKNISQQKIDSAYFALWNNTVVRNINITPAGSGGSAFYNKGGNGYLDSHYIAYCYDAAGDLGFTENYIGQKFLGAEDKNGFHHPKLNQNFKAHYNAWEFRNTSNPVFFMPNSEQARYQKLTKGLNDELCWDQNSASNPDCDVLSLKEKLNQAGNRSDLLSVGPFIDFQPGDEIKVSYAYILAKKFEDGLPNSDNNETQRKNFLDNAEWAQTAYNGEDKNFNGILDDGEDVDGNGVISRYILPTPPDIPQIKVLASDNKIEIYWTDNSENSIDPITLEKDFEGYRIYMSKFGFDVTKTPNLQEDMVRIAEYDLKGNQLFLETGFEPIKLEKPIQFENDQRLYTYKYTLENVLPGWQYAIAVTAFDRGNEASNLESLESSFLSNTKRVFPGTTPNDDIKKNEPFVYPNPYYGGASWEGNSNFQEQSRKIYFANIPERCKIRVYTVGGDFIDEINHDQNYNGADIRWFNTFGSENPDENVFSGGLHAWDLLSLNTQIISRGLYIFTVEDLETGDTYKGQFTIIK